ncbi:MAG TPA: TonB-dependent receptor [Caulobacteraceae bacterium]|nr:TonB-dependent receptor [Caulobacteraceae bacterium]
MGRDRRGHKPWLGELSSVVLIGVLGGALPANAAPDPRSAAGGTSADTAAGGARVSEFVVTSKRLDQARASIQPQIGASVYTITNDAIQTMPGGDSAPLDQVILQAPGVAEDSYGQIHVRGEHNGLQFRLNGVILPEGLSVFSQALSPKLADKVDLITGALPAQYGLRTAGVVDITTKSRFDNGGEVSMYGGSHDEINPNGNIHGSSGAFSYFVTVNYLQDKLGIESPDGSANPLHDKTNQFQAFAYLEDILDPQSRVTLIAGTSDQRFQIPDQRGGQPTLGLSVGDPTGAPNAFSSENLNENQRENTQFAALSYLYDGGRFTGQVSLFGRYSTLRFLPDPLGDVLYNGIAQTAYKTDLASGIQAEGVYRLTDAHTLRGGVIIEIDRSTSRTSSQVLPLDATGAQTGGPPFEPVTILDSGAKTAKTYTAYLQDEWKLLSNLTLNYGVRFDEFDGYRDQNQVSPRVNLVWQVTPTTTFHAGYSRYFSPPPFELIGQETVSKFAGTTAAATVPLDTTPYAERANYYDVGLSQVFMRYLNVGLDGYYKTDKDLIDEGQFGAPIILTPFNYATGYQYGIELTSSYSHRGLTIYANFAAQTAKGKDIISSQFNFSPDRLAYITSHYINLDHSATYTASGGISYLWHGTRVGGDVLYGSGLRTDLVLPDGSAIPNGAELPSYTQINLSLSHRFEKAPLGPLTVRFDVINAFNETIELRNGSGVGVFAPQFGPRQGFFGGVTKEF